MVGEVPLPEPDPPRWREQVRQIWTDSHAALARNGDIARMALGRVPMGPNALRVAERTMTIMRAGGVPDQAVAWAIDVIGLYVAANAVEGAVHTANQKAGRDPMEHFADVQRVFEALPADRFPTTAALLPFLLTGDGDERFAFGLDLMLDGLAARAG